MIEVAEFAADILQIQEDFDSFKGSDFRYWKRKMCEKYFANFGGICEICDTFSAVKVVELKVEYSFPRNRKYLQITIVSIMPIPIMPNPIIPNNICVKKSM